LKKKTDRNVHQEVEGEPTKGEPMRGGSPGKRKKKGDSPLHSTPLWSGVTGNDWGKRTPKWPKKGERGGDKLPGAGGGLRRKLRRTETSMA